ncbi:D-glucuronyl C5-epimerase family protein [Candidatus Nitrosocosmicus arcticus]|nr:D-glucuronyl C5-epimerase family protein [Candidatus Nitrosocosmicus arcticus]
MIAFISIVFLISLKVCSPPLVVGKIFYDKNNVPLVDYGVMSSIDIGKQYNPITISHNASKYYNEYIKNNNETSKGYFLNHVNWLVNNSVQKDNNTFFVYDFPFPPYYLKAPWYSAMAQGAAIQPLLNAYKITHDKVYLTTAKNALNVLFIDINDPCNCGVTYKTPGEGWWYEEYANGRENGPRVLNGMMFTLVDIHYYYNFTQDPDALYLFNQGILSLKNNLHNYDKNGTYSSYDKIRGYAPIEYHNVHVCLLNKLYNITNDSIFKQYYESWTKSNNDHIKIDKNSESCF